MRLVAAVLACVLGLAGPAHAKGILGARAFSVPDSATTRYQWYAAQSTVSQAAIAGIVGHDFTAGGFRCETTGGDAGDAGDSWTFTLMRAPFSDPTAWVDTDLSCVIDGDTTGASCVDATGNTTHSILAGDSLALKVVGAGTPVFGEFVSCVITQDVGLTVGVSNFSAPTGTTTVWGMHSVGGTTADKDFPMVLPQAVTLSDLYCVSDNAPGGSATYVVTVMKSLAASPNTFNTTALTVTFGSADTKKNLAGNGTSFAVGDNVLFQVVPTGSPGGAAKIRCGLKGS